MEHRSAFFKKREKTCEESVIKVVPQVTGGIMNKNG
jgi:hypothetical protein